MYKLVFGQTADYQVYGLSGIKPAYYQVSSAILLQPADYEVNGLFDGQYAGFFQLYEPFGEQPADYLVYFLCR